MRNLTRMFTISAVLILGLVAVGAAQMMGGSQGNGTTNAVTDSTSQQNNANFMKMMDNMSNRNQMMNRDFDKLEAGYNQMMGMNDMQALKSELKQQQEMVRTMHNNMGQQQTMLQNMMTMMNSGGQNMMGQRQNMMNQHQSMMGQGMMGTHANNNTGNKNMHSNGN